MCRLFLAVDRSAYAAETRTIRLHGHVTSVRLEKAFWAIIEEIAGREEIPIARFVTTLYDEIIEKDGEVPNFASLLRVTCMQYLRHPELHAGEIAKLQTDPAARNGTHDESRAVAA